MIILNNGHTPRSPGGVFGGRTEYGASAVLMGKIRDELSSLPVKITEGTDSLGDDGLLFVFHKGTAVKTAPTDGAEIFVSENASAQTQYNAYCLLRALCDSSGYRYKGVHTLTEKSPFRSLFTKNNENAYLIKAGYIDCERDNMIWDRELGNIAGAVSREIMRIYKENENENYS